MKSVALISVFAIAIGPAAASDCEMLLDQFDEQADACNQTCYGEGSEPREGLVEIAEVCLLLGHFCKTTLHATSFQGYACKNHCTMINMNLTYEEDAWPSLPKLYKYLYYF